MMQWFYSVCLFLALSILLGGCHIGGHGGHWSKESVKHDREMHRESSKREAEHQREAQKRDAEKAREAAKREQEGKK